MQVCLHLGAHRCATSSFQEYLRQNAAELEGDGIGVWGPRHTRKGLFHGVLPVPSFHSKKAQAKRAQGRLRMKLDSHRARSIQQLLISDENVIGSARANLYQADLYGDVGDRMTRFFAAFDGAITSIALNIRSLEAYWASVISCAVARGISVPQASHLQRLAEARRSWRDVITDIACAMPEVEIKVLPFETFGGRPETQLSLLTGKETPKTHARVRLNSALRLEDLRRHMAPMAARDLPAGEGRWRPFASGQTALLRENYADDLMWLVAGADGLAQLVQDPEHKVAGVNLPQTDETRGTPDDKKDRRLAGSG